MGIDHAAYLPAMSGALITSTMVWLLGMVACVTRDGQIYKSPLDR